MVRPKNQLIWSHYRETDNKSATCKHCEKRYKIPNLQKMSRHLLKCLNCPESSKQQVRTSSHKNTNSPQSLASNALCQAVANKENVIPGVNSLTDESTASSSRSREPDLSVGAHEKLHSLLAKAIYVSGTPLTIVEHPLWLNFFEHLQPLYKLRTRKTISTNILDKTYKEMHRELKDELKSQSCLHLQLDGWSNCRNESIINVLISKPEPVFVKSIATAENRHTSEYLCEEIYNVLDEYGANKISTLIGDNASNIQRAFRLVKEIHPHLTCLNCTAHTLHLLCKDIGRYSVIKACKEMATNLIKTIKRSQVLTYLLAKIVKEKNAGETLKLPCDTRWGSYCTSFKSIQNTKVALQTLAVHENATLLPTEEKSSLLDDNFWEIIRQCIILLQPISDAILSLESNEENIHKVFLTLKNMKSKLLFSLPDITIIDNDIKDEMLINVDARMNMCLKPIHFAAYLLDPTVQGAELDEQQELDAMEYINDVGQSIGVNVMTNLASYKARDGFWSRRFIYENISEVRPTTWWKGICGSTALSKVAYRVLTAPSTSAAVERSFSAHSNIHNKKRNRLTTERAAKLTFISYNWNLLNKRRNNVNEDTEECMSDSPPLSGRQNSSLPSPTRTVSPEATTSSGINNFEFLDCDRITDTSSSDDDETQ